MNADSVRKNDVKSPKNKFGQNSVQFVLYLDGILDENCFINFNGVIEYHGPHFKNFFSNDVIKKSFNKRKLYLENDFGVIIKVKRFLCKKCRKYSQLKLNGIYKDYFNFSVKIKNKAINLRISGQNSLRNVSQTYNIFNGVKISYEIIRQTLLVFDGLLYLNEELNPSSYVGYDVQWISINKKGYWRHMLFDIINKMPILELLVKKEDYETTQYFLKQIIQPKDIIAIFTDLKPSYDKIMVEIGFVH